MYVQMYSIDIKQVIDIRLLVIIPATAASVILIFSFMRYYVIHHEAMPLLNCIYGQCLISKSFHTVSAAETLEVKSK